MWKFKSWKGKDKYQLLLTIGVIFCILAFPAERFSEKAAERKDAGESVAERKKETGAGVNSSVMDLAVVNSTDTAEASAASAGTYEAMLEKRVRDILKHVDGVGTVDVMIVLKSSAEKRDSCG